MRTRILLHLALAGALGSLASAAEEPAIPSLPISATRISLGPKPATLANAFAAFKAAGFTVEAPEGMSETGEFKFGELPFWEAVERVANANGRRIELHDHGKRIVLAKRDGGHEVSCIRGPFRIAVKQVNGRLDLETGHSFQELQLDAHWEPRFPVFRIDSVPTITLAKDDFGNTLTASSASALSPVNGAASHVLPVRLLNVPRKAGQIAELKGHFTVTASERMLPFAFQNLGGKLPIAGVLPNGVRSGSVSATLTGWQIENLGGKAFWEATIDLKYPAGMPVFQSFESWLGENRLRLVSPQGTAIAPDQVEEPGVGREMTVVYRFDAAKLGGVPNGKGWSLVYETPAPLVEFKVPFELKNVPLP